MKLSSKPTHELTGPALRTLSRQKVGIQDNRITIVDQMLWLLLISAIWQVHSSERVIDTVIGPKPVNEGGGGRSLYQ